MRLNNFAVNSPLSIWVQRSSNDRMFSLQPTPLQKSRHLLKFSSSLLSPLPESSAELSTNGAKNHVSNSIFLRMLNDNTSFHQILSCLGKS